LSREPSFYQQPDLPFRCSSTVEVLENPAQNQSSHHVFIATDALRRGRDRVENIFERNNRAATNARPDPRARNTPHEPSDKG